MLETVLQHLQDGIVVTAASGERLYANDEAARLTGFASSDELIVAGLEGAVRRFEILHPDGRPLDPTELPARRALAGEEPEPMLVRFRTGAAEGGPDRLSLVRAVPVSDESGALAYVISIFREVTAEQSLAERARVSAGAAAVLNATLDYDRILDAIVRFAVPDLADGCAVDVLERRPAPCRVERGCDRCLVAVRTRRRDTRAAPRRIVDVCAARVRHACPRDDRLRGAGAEV